MKFFAFVLASQVISIEATIGDPCSGYVYPWNCGKYECCGIATPDNRFERFQSEKTICNINGASKYVEPQDSRIKYNY